MCLKIDQYLPLSYDRAVYHSEGAVGYKILEEAKVIKEFLNHVNLGKNN